MFEETLVIVRGRWYSARRALCERWWTLVIVGDRRWSVENAGPKIKFWTCTKVLMETSVLQRLTLNAAERCRTFVERCTNVRLTLQRVRISLVSRYPSVTWLLLIVHNICFAVNDSLATCQRPLFNIQKNKSTVNSQRFIPVLNTPPTRQQHASMSLVTR